MAEAARRDALIDRIDERRIVETLAATVEAGAASCPLLGSAAAAALVEAAAALTYRRARPVIGEGDRAVHQDFEICMGVPETSVFRQVARELEAALDAGLARLNPRPLARFRINDIVLQRYHPGSRGITAHRDHIRYVGLVAIIQLSGDGVFALCDNRAGTNLRVIPCGPGDLLLMRAPRYAGRTDRPFHLVRAIGVERYSLGLREDSRAGEG